MSEPDIEVKVRACDRPETVNRRHVTAYRRFQNVALRALSDINKLLKGESASDKSPVKVGELKGLVSAYRDAAVAERSALGMDSPDKQVRTGEMLVRWVDDDDPMTAGYGDA